MIFKEGKMKYLKILIFILLAVLLYYFKNRIELDNIIKILVILGFIVSFLTLYYNFWKPQKLELKIGKRLFLIWHDRTLNSSPMIDVFCTILNHGASAIFVEGISIELVKDNKSTQFSDYFFLKLINGSAFQPYEFSHPIVVNKYSSSSIMIAFKNGELKYKFEEGRYELVAKAILKDQYIVEDRINFSLTQKQIEQINNNKANNKNDGVEILL